MRLTPYDSVFPNCRGNIYKERVQLTEEKEKKLTWKSIARILMQVKSMFAPLKRDMIGTREGVEGRGREDSENCLCL
jgi:hypothetical protein